MEDDSVKTLIDETTELTKDAIDKISELHKTMFGVNHSKSVKMYCSFVKYLRDFYEDLINSCQIKMEVMEKEVQLKCNEILTLKNELNMESEVTCNFEPLSAAIEKLDELSGRLLSIKTERMERLDALLKKEMELCNVLDVSSFPPICGVPTEEEIKELSLHITKLQQEKISRINLYSKTKQSIISLMDELEYQHKLPFHLEIVNSVEESYNLKLDYLERMSNFEEELKQELETAAKNIEYLKDKLSKLWERIKTEENHRVSFSKNIKGVGKSFQDLLKNELLRCEEIKRANIKPVIESVRCDINDIWIKLTYTEDQKKLFISYYSDTFSDDVLELLEIELNKLNSLYEENKHIYELAEKRESLWKRMQHLDEVALDKNRFKNRGGQLLKEEKERKLLENRVPKTDLQLKNYLNEYKEKTGNSFLWYGKDLLQKISDDWERRQNLKDAKKGTRKLEDHHKMMNPDCQQEELRLATKRKLEIPTENIPQKTLKKTPKKCINIINPASSLKNKCGVTPSTDLSTDSISSYSTFQEQIAVGCEVALYSNKRGALKEINSPIRAHSSPTSTPIRCKTPKTPHTTPGKRKCLMKKWR